MNICWKSSNYSIEKNTLQAPGSLQLYGGQVVGFETVIHAKYDIFNDGNTKGILLIYAGNAFNLINRKVMLYNLKFICLVIATYIYQTVTYAILDFLSLVEEKYHLKRVQHQLIQHRWELMLSRYYHCVSFYSVSFLS